MTDRPIIFGSAMILALIAGRKTQTRRVLKDAPAGEGWHCDPSPKGLRWVADGGAPSMPIVLPWQIGDRLWVRESFSFREAIYSNRDLLPNGLPRPWYWADGRIADGDCCRPKPAIHMPRWASRITLTVTDVRVQRLQEITEEDAVAEGVRTTAPGFPKHGIYAIALPDGKTHFDDSAYRLYGKLWDAIHGYGSWLLNPFVAALSFTVDLRNIDDANARVAA